MDKRIEIFAVGKWNGMTFTKKDLESIVSAFNALGSNHKVPLKFGHNKKQPMTDGQPALGWVNGLSISGDKLVAEVTDIPDIVMSAMDKKLYHNVSVELDFDVKYKNQQFPIVLSGVALLGADIPAVNTLKDLTHYLDRGAGFSVGRQAMFSAIAGNKQGETDMELDELVKQVGELTKKVGDFSATIATLTAENNTLKAEKEATAAANAKAEMAAKTAKIAEKRKEVSAVFEAGITAKSIVPAQRESFSKILRLEDDAALEALDIEEVKKLVSNGAKVDFGRSQGKQTDESHTDERAPDVILSERIGIVLSKKEAPDHASAQSLVFQRDPALARAYVTMNGRA